MTEKWLTIGIFTILAMLFKHVLRVMQKSICFKNDKNLVNFDPSTQFFKICTVICPFGAKYITFDKKKSIYRGVMFDSTEYWCKIWRKTDLCFQKWHEEFGKFSPEHVRKSKNWDFYWVLLSKVENVWA